MTLRDSQCFSFLANKIDNTRCLLIYIKNNVPDALLTSKMVLKPYVLRFMSMGNLYTLLILTSTKNRYLMICLFIYLMRPVFWLVMLMLITNPWLVLDLAISILGFGYISGRVC